MAATCLDLAILDFVKDNIAIDPQMVLLGFIGARACYVAGTQVVTNIEKNGDLATKNIQDIKVGDYVLSRDQLDEHGKDEYRKVTRVFVKTSDHLRILRVRAADGNVETIRTTDDHPFWVEGIGWLAAKELRSGESVVGPGGPDAKVISSVREEHPEGVTVYNFEVEGDHTYFVEDRKGEKTAIWVHNECARQLNLALKATGQAVVKVSGIVVREGLEAAAHLVPRGAFSRRQKDVVDAIRAAKEALAEAGIGIDEAINGFLTKASNQLGTHTNAFFRRMGDLFKSKSAAEALETLLQEVKDGKFLKK